MKQFQITAGELKAAYLFASEDDGRYVMNGVHVEVVPDKPPVIVACDGRRLVAISTERDQEPSEAFEVTLSPILVSAVLSLAKVKDWVMFTVGDQVKDNIPVEVCNVPRTWVLTMAEHGGIDGQYPNWRQIIPDKDKREPIQAIGFNGEYLADFAKAAKCLGAKDPSLQMYFTHEGGIVTVELVAKQNFYGVIMPVRTEPKANFQPEFLSGNGCTVTMETGNVSVPPAQEGIWH